MDQKNVQRPYLEKAGTQLQWSINKRKCGKIGIRTSGITTLSKIIKLTHTSIFSFNSISQVLRMVHGTSRQLIMTFEKWDLE